MTSEVLKFTNNDTARIRSQQKEIKLDLELDSCEPKEKIKEICFELIFSYVFFLLFDKESKCLIRDQQMPLGVNLIENDKWLKERNHKVKEDKPKDGNKKRKRKRTQIMKIKNENKIHIRRK